jgi:hypothetical protein
MNLYKVTGTYLPGIPEGATQLTVGTMQVYAVDAQQAINFFKNYISDNFAAAPYNIKASGPAAQFLSLSTVP